MPGRLVPLVNNEYYHVFNRGSDKRNIFGQPRDYKRFQQTFYYYQFQGPKPRFSISSNKISFIGPPEKKMVEIISYCLMPNHYHFLVRQLKDNGISTFISQLSNSYTKYFNTKYRRIGPLLQGTFKAVLVQTNEQLIHLSRYIHINPLVSQLAKELENYPWSSYNEYFSESKLCDTKVILNLFPSKESYKQFLADQVDYGRSLEISKHRLIDNDFDLTP